MRIAYQRTGWRMLGIVSRPPTHPAVIGQQGKQRTTDETETHRKAVLSVARSQLETEGPGALGVRKLATTMNTSYQLLYTLFESKDGLMNALHQCGFTELAHACRAALKHGDAIDDLVAVALAYRKFALANPQLFSLMFGKAVLGFTPTPESNHHARRSFSVIEEVIANGNAHTLRAMTPDQITKFAQSLWATTHGHTSLELQHWIDNKGRASELMLIAAIRGIATSEFHGSTHV